MRFRVPQFIDVKDKIFGPLTFRQFLYLAGGAGLIAIIYYFFKSFIVTILLGLPVAVLVLALAFYKVNQKPFIYLVEAFFRYIISARFYIWKRRRKKRAQNMSHTAGASSTLSIPQIGGKSKLKELTWSLDVTDSSSPVSEKQEAESGANAKSTTDVENRS